MRAGGTWRREEGPSIEVDVLLEVRRLRKYFPVTSGVLFQRRVGLIKAVDDVSFSIRKGETLGLAGEAGSGKPTDQRGAAAGAREPGGEGRGARAGEGTPLGGGAQPRDGGSVPP